MMFGIKPIYYYNVLYTLNFAWKISNNLLINIHNKTISNILNEYYIIYNEYLKIKNKSNSQILNILNTKCINIFLLLLYYHLFYL